MNLLTSINKKNQDFENIKNGKILRIDYNYRDNEVFYLLNFNNLEDANHFQKNLKIKPKTISISNS